MIPLDFNTGIPASLQNRKTTLLIRCEFAPSYLVNLQVLKSYLELNFQYRKQVTRGWAWFVCFVKTVTKTKTFLSKILRIDIDPS